MRAWAELTFHAALVMWRSSRAFGSRRLRVSGWRYAYLIGGAALTVLLAMAPEAYRNKCPVCMLQSDVQVVGLAIYATVMLLGVSIFIAALNLERRSFWWLASPAYALMGGFGLGIIVMTGWALVT